MLSISDNGCGLPDDRRTQPRSYGLMGMQERVAQLEGTIKFDSSPDGGFCVIVTLPPNSTETRSLA
jgi:signal transduction histidine kinase